MTGDTTVAGGALDGDAAIVTGASAGIGRQTARAVARAGAGVALAARSRGRLKDLADELRATFDVEAVVAPTNVREEREVDALVETTVEMFGRLDILVNNAGVVRGGPLDSTTTEDYRVTMGTNVDGMFFATHAVLPHLRETGGSLVFIGSFAG